MARTLGVRPNPANPDVFGEDAMFLLESAAGLGITAWVNDNLAAPVVKQVVPQAAAGAGMAAKAIDAGTTAVSAWLLGEGVSLLDRRIAMRLKLGGLILAGGRLLSAVVPGFQISATMPKSIGGWQLPAVSAPKTNGTNGSTTAAALPPASTRLGVGSMGI